MSAPGTDPPGATAAALQKKLRELISTPVKTKTKQKNKTRKRNQIRWCVTFSGLQAAISCRIDFLFAGGGTLCSQDVEKGGK